MGSLALLKIVLDILKYAGPSASCILSGIYLYHLGTTRDRKGWNPAVKERVGIQKKGFFLILLGVIIAVVMEVLRAVGIF